MRTAHTAPSQALFHGHVRVLSSEKKGYVKRGGLWLIWSAEWFPRDVEDRI